LFFRNQGVFYEGGNGFRASDSLRKTRVFHFGAELSLSSHNSSEKKVGLGFMKSMATGEVI